MRQTLLHFVLPIAGVVVVAMLVFHNGLNSPFFHDDHSSITDNAHIETLWPITEAMATPEMSTVSGRPIVALSLALNYALGGREPWGYHVFNLCVHMLNGVLIFVILRRLLTMTALWPGQQSGHGQPRVATLTSSLIALIWLVHPLQTETVVWTIQRTELIVVFFLLATLWACSNALESPRRGVRIAWCVAGVVACAAGMGSKEVMVAAPLLVVAYDWSFSGRSPRALWRTRWPLYAALATTWVLLIGIILSSPRGNTVAFDLGVGPFEYLRTQAQVLMHYLRLSIWPHPLVVAYDWPIAESWVPTILPGLGILFLLGLTVYALVRRHPLGFFGAVFFLILAPSSSFVPIVTEVAAERRMYLPLLSVIVVVWFVLSRLSAGIPASRFRVAAGATVGTIIVGVGSIMSIDRIRDYENLESIWRANYAVYPHRHAGNSGLGTALAKLERFDEAIPFLERAVNAMPDDVYSREALALALARENRFDDAIAQYQAVLIRLPASAKAFHNLGLIFQQTGRYREAADHLREADRIRPDYPATLASLAQVHVADPTSDIYRPTSAIAFARRANEITGFAQPVLLAILADVYLAARQPEAAIATINHALQLEASSGAEDRSRFAALRREAEAMLPRSGG